MKVLWLSAQACPHVVVSHADLHVQRRDAGVHTRWSALEPVPLR